ERGLERVLGVVVVAEDAAADAPHHRRVPPHERLDRRLVPVADEPLEQLAVPGRVRRPFCPAEAPKDRSAGGHATPLPTPDRYPHRGYLMRGGGGPGGRRAGGLAWYPPPDRTGAKRRALEVKRREPRPSPGPLAYSIASRAIGPVDRCYSSRSNSGIRWCGSGR